MDAIPTITLSPAVVEAVARVDDGSSTAIVVVEGVVVEVTVKMKVVAITTLKLSSYQYAFSRLSMLISPDVAISC